MTPNPSVMQAVEKLGYRVTIGDVASQAGLNVRLAEKEVLALASETGGNLQVAESGDIAYVFPPNFRSILRNKSARLRWQERWQKVWRILFYLIRVSFGLVLMLSIALILAAIAVIVIAATMNNDDREGGSDSGFGGGFGGGGFGMGGGWTWIFLPDFSSPYGSQRYRSSSGGKRGKSRREPSEMNFLEAIFSFLFGDGDPNFDLDDRRWQSIAAVIRNSGGAVTAEQIAPYLDELGSTGDQEYEAYMLPVLSRFNGRPEVSPEGQIIYHFPELQVTAMQRLQAVSAYLKELPWRFSQASSGQIIGAIALGCVNLGGALVLGALLRQVIVQAGSFVGFVSGIYGLLLAYGIGFLAIPLLRYFWVQWRNTAVNSRNDRRQQRAMALNQANETLQHKLAFAKQFAATQVLSEADLAYTTEEDLTSQSLRQADKIDAEWQKRLEQSN